MNIPPTVIGANILLIICDIILSELLPEKPISRLDDDIAESYIAVIDVKKQPTKPNKEDAAIIIESVF